MNLAPFRLILPWLIVAGVSGFAVYQLKVKPAEVIVPKVIQSNNEDQIMGTATLVPSATLMELISLDEL